MLTGSAATRSTGWACPSSASTSKLESSLSMRLMPSRFHEPSVCVTGPRNWVGLGGRDPSEVSPCPPAFPPALSLPPTTPPPIPIPAGAADHLRRRSQSSAPQTTGAGRAGAGAAAGPGAAAAGPGAAHFRGGNGGIKHTVAYPIDVQDMQEQGQSRCTQQQAGTAGNRLSRIRKDKYG